uniref:Uncharacterized protein n=1 Tax=Rhizophora mucronata TaxID=61149 RepID=A0A2P2LUS1_RHIMU
MILTKSLKLKRGQRHNFLINRAPSL